MWHYLLLNKLFGFDYVIAKDTPFVYRVRTDVKKIPFVYRLKCYQEIKPHYIGDYFWITCDSSKYFPSNLPT